MWVFTENYGPWPEIKEEFVMRMRNLLLGLALAGVATIASAAGGKLPPPGWVYTYFENGQAVGQAVHNQCTGEITVTGTVTSDYVGEQTVSC